MSRPARATPEEESFALAKESRSASSKAEELARPSNDDPIGWDRMDGRAHVTARRLPLREESDVILIFLSCTTSMPWGLLGALVLRT